MGSLVGKQQYDEVLRKVNLLKAETELVYDGKQELIDADYEERSVYESQIIPE